MNNYSERKQDLGGWSAKFGEETRKHRHPCKYNEGHPADYQPTYGKMCLLVNFLHFKRIINGYSGL